MHTGICWEKYIKEENGINFDCFTQFSLSLYLDYLSLKCNWHCQLLHWSDCLCPRWQCHPERQGHDHCVESQLLPRLGLKRKKSVGNYLPHSYRTIVPFKEGASFGSASMFKLWFQCNGRLPVTYFLSAASADLINALFSGDLFSKMVPECKDCNRN